MAGGFLPYEVFDPPHMLVPASALAPAANPVNVVTSLDPNPTVKTPHKANPAVSPSPELSSITLKPLIPDPGRHTKDAGHKFRGYIKSASTANLENIDVKESTHPSAQKKPGGASQAAFDPNLISNSFGSHSQQASPGIGALIFSAMGASWVPNPKAKSSGGRIVGSSKRDGLPSVLEEDPAAVPLDGSTISPNKAGKYVAGVSTENRLEGSIRSSKPRILDTSGDGYFTFAGQVLTTHLSDVLVDGTTIKPGGTGITRSGRLISLDSDGNLVVDTSTVQAANYAPKTLDGQTFNKDPSLLAVDDRTITPGGSEITISGTPVRLNPDGNLIVDTKTVELANIFSTPPPSIYTIDGQLFTGDPSFLSVGGKTMSPGGFGITISGTPIRLDPAGNLIIDTSTAKLGNISPTPFPSIYTINGQQFAGNPSLLSVDGKTITAGGAGITISGIPVLLKSSGVLRFGTKEIPLPTNGSSYDISGSRAPETFLGGQERVQISMKKVIFWGLLIATGFMVGDLYSFS